MSNPTDPADATHGLRMPVNGALERLRRSGLLPRQRIVGHHARQRRQAAATR
jgi:hypothetical protein